MPKKGLFIVFEGIDGAGTTTQAKKLVNWLKSIGREAIYTCEPTGYLTGQIIRLVLKGAIKCSQRVLALLFAADRVYHLERKIKPAIEKGIIVVSDRYVLSSLAYQGVDLEENWLREINKFAVKPDLTFYLDIEVEEAIKRMGSKSRDIFENREMLHKIRENYIRIISPKSGVIILDSSKPVEEVFKQVIQEVSKLLV